jgi:hypothetical protein
VCAPKRKRKKQQTNKPHTHIHTQTLQAIKQKSTNQMIKNITWRFINFSLLAWISHISCTLFVKPKQQIGITHFKCYIENWLPD